MTTEQARQELNAAENAANAIIPNTPENLEAFRAAEKARKAAYLVWADLARRNPIRVNDGRTGYGE